MNDTLALLQRIGSDGRKDLLQTWFNGQKNLVTAYNSNPYVPRDVFMYNLIDGFYSPYKREVWAHLATIDISALEAFETSHAVLLATIN